MTDDLRLALRRTHGPLTVAAVSGPIDLHTAPRLRTGALELIERGHHRLVLDLTGVTFCDSSGLSALIGAWHAAQGAGGSLGLAAVPDHLMRLLAMTGLDTVMSILPAADALAAHPQDA
ncbi:STAS domain-containing protein [Streptomyces sp. Act-28]